MSELNDLSEAQEILPPVILASVANLYFSSRIEVAAEHYGCEVRFLPVRGGEYLLTGLGRSQAKKDMAQPDLKPDRYSRVRLVIVDLNQGGSVEWIAHLKSNPEAVEIPVVAFGSHVDTEVLVNARKAGADKVLARSRFVELLPELIAGLVQ